MKVRKKIGNVKKEDRTFFKVEFKYDSIGHIHFVNPQCDEMDATDCFKIIGALSKIEKEREE